MLGVKFSARTWELCRSEGASYFPTSSFHTVNAPSLPSKLHPLNIPGHYCADPPKMFEQLFDFFALLFRLLVECSAACNWLMHTCLSSQSYHARPFGKHLLTSAFSLEDLFLRLQLLQLRLNPRVFGSCSVAAWPELPQRCVSYICNSSLLWTFARSLLHLSSWSFRSQHFQRHPCLDPNCWLCLCIVNTVDVTPKLDVVVQFLSPS